MNYGYDNYGTLLEQDIINIKQEADQIRMETVEEFHRKATQMKSFHTRLETRESKHGSGDHHFLVWNPLRPILYVMTSSASPCGGTLPLSLF